MQYVRRLIEGAPVGTRISLSSFASALAHPGARAALAAAASPVNVHAIDGEQAFEQRTRGADGFGLQPAYWKLLRRHWRQLTPEMQGDVVIVPYLDYISYAIGLVGSPFGDTPISGIVMRPDFHWAEQGVVAPPVRHRLLKRMLFERLLRHRRLRNLVTIDPSLRDWVAGHVPRGHERLRYADDPADLSGFGDRAAARVHFGLHAQASVLLLFGSIDLRKGVASLLDVAASPLFPADGQVLIVGRQSDAARVAIDAARARLPAHRFVIVDRYADRQDEWAAFSAADYGWLAYEGFYGPSGVLAQCRQARLGVVYRAAGLIGYQLRDAAPIAVDWLQAHGLHVARPEAGASTLADIGQVMA